MYGNGRTEYTTIDAQIPGRPPVMCAGCPHRGIFYILHKKKIMVYGDIGCYTLGAVAPLNAMDLNVFTALTRLWEKQARVTA